MDIEGLKEFFKDITIWKGVAILVIGTVIAAAFIGVFVCIKDFILDKEKEVVETVEIQSGSVAVHAEGEAKVTINIYDHQDGLPSMPEKEKRDLYEQAREKLEQKDYDGARECFDQLAAQEKDKEKLAALEIQTGNIHYAMRSYVRASEHYAKSLRLARGAGDPQGEASALGSIANTYMDRPATSGKARGENVRSAVKNYLEALEIFKKDEYPVEYAGTQNNLGIAYRALPAGDNAERADNVRKAIDCYNAALEIYRKKEYPVEYAMTQNNLGVSYGNLSSVDSAECAAHVRKAIECFNAALEIYRKKEYPVEYATTQNNLGNAYRDLPAANSVRRAIEFYNAALEISRKDEYPLQYAMTQNNLGTAYKDLPAGDSAERANNVRKEIECYNAALEIYRKDEYPQKYCITSANLGGALAEMEDPEACFWLKEAYSLRELLPDQGKSIEDIMNEVCKE